MPTPPSPRCSRLPSPPLPPRHRARSLLPVMPAQAPRCRPPSPPRTTDSAILGPALPEWAQATPWLAPQSSAPHSLSRAPMGSRPSPDTMICPTLNLATTPSTTPPSFLATTPSLDGRRDWWHLPDLGARLILAPNAAPPPIRAASSDGSQDNAPSPSPEPRRLTFQGCRSAILTSSSLAVARPPDRRLRPRDPPDSPTSPSTAASITHLLHADEKARPPLSPRPPTTRLLNKDLSMHPVDGFSAGLVDDINVFEWQVTEENLAALFINCGQVVDCRMCGDPNSVLRFTFIEFTDEEGARAALNLSGTVLRYYPVSVLPSKTAIAPVNPTFLPRSDDEQEMCARTIYCTNIDKKVTQADLKLFFESICGEKMTIQPTQYHWLTAMTATGLSAEVAWYLSAGTLGLKGAFSKVAKLELVMLVHPADCKSMLDAFIAGCDFHSRTTMSMYQHIRETVEEEKVILE
ncbi:Polyadenylate-binding protein-interacting protein 10 [Zea mays]|uniref:Polyadenylate-binding protein-interacting protein 10 n=1 Tax=Zea mays TaxID=4577 RepID=A0A317Y255_MAIZE|nr:Polyadenylate-binding protein-interacting protein 10 [Zea mays]